MIINKNDSPIVNMDFASLYPQPIKNLNSIHYIKLLRKLKFRKLFNNEKNIS